MAIPNQAFRFADLYPELKNAIYDQVFSTQEDTTTDSKDDNNNEEEEEEVIDIENCDWLLTKINLLKASREIYNDAHGYYSSLRLPDKTLRVPLYQDEAENDRVTRLCRSFPLESVKRVRLSLIPTDTHRPRRLPGRDDHEHEHEHAPPPRAEPSCSGRRLPPRPPAHVDFTFRPALSLTSSSCPPTLFPQHLLAHVPGATSWRTLYRFVRTAVRLRGRGCWDEVVRGSPE